MPEDNRTPATVKEMLIDLSGKFDVLNTELRYDRAASVNENMRLYRELDEARAEREAMKVDIREVRDRKTVSPKELWTTVLGALAGASAIAGVVFGVINAVKV